MTLTSERAGQLIEVNNSYRCFVPHSLASLDIHLDTKLQALLNEAHLLLGRLDGIAISIPDSLLFVSMYVQKEAVMSTQIEGTQASLVDVLQKDRDSGQVKDIEEIVNYIKAMNYATDSSQQLPLCNRLLREIHRVLLSGVRGGGKAPGDFRKTQNWIGYAGCDLNRAYYVPPAPEYMHEALADLENYIHAPKAYSELVAVALLHYQFETIHPFLDGNGRVGRLLIPLYLKEKGIIEHPVLYLSYYFKKHRAKYYELLTEVRCNGSFEKWIAFFVQGICEISKNAIDSIQKLAMLKQEDSQKITKLANKQVADLIKIHNFLFGHPYVQVEDLKALLGVSAPTCSRLIKQLIELGILEACDNKKRYKQYVYKNYVEILREGTDLTSY